MTNAFDIEDPRMLLAYLRATGRLGREEVPEFTSLKGGVSNRTVLVERPNGESWVIKQALPKLRVAEDWFSDPARIHREALGLHWLSRLTPPGSVPKLVFEDYKHHLLAMEAVPKPHENWKTRLLSGRIDREHVLTFGRLLGTIHQRSRELPQDVLALFADRTHFETLRLEPYYRFTATRNSAAAPFFEQLIADTLATRFTLVHGDYSPKNVLIHRERLVLLDHEVIHFGDPAFDLGFAAIHFLSKANHLSDKRADFLEAAQLFWNAYVHAAGDLVGESLERRAVRHTLACLLARIDGRSPLEYLSGKQRNRQRAAVLSWTGQPPSTFSELIRAFGSALDRKADDSENGS